MDSQHELAMHEDLLNDRQDQASSAELKQRHDMDTTEESTTTKSLPSPVHPSEPKALDSRDVESLEEITDCMVQFQTSEPVGFLNAAHNEYSIGLSLQAGTSGPVSISLDFRQPGQIDGIFARKTWHLIDRLPGLWIVQDFGFVIAHTVPLNKAANHPKIVSQLEADDEAAGRLVCITLRVMPLPKEIYKESIVYKTSGDFFSCLRGIFKSDKAHNVRIWFLVPKSNLNLGGRLLATMKDRYSRREHSLGHVQDDFGVHLSDHLARQTNFTSLPRELRDRIYELTILDNYAGTPDIMIEYIRSMENGRCDHEKDKAYALFSTRASTIQIAAEAREFFYKRNHFGLRLWSSEIEELVNNEDWSVARSHLQLFVVEPEDIRLEDPEKFSQQLNLLLKYPKLRSVEILIIQGRSSKPRTTFDRWELQQALIDYADSCRQLSDRLGNGLTFHFNIDCAAYDDEEGSKFYKGWFRVMFECGMDRLKEFCAALDGPSDDLRPMDGRSPQKFLDDEKELQKFKERWDREQS